MTLGQMIRQYRKKNHISLRKFAARAESTAAYISMLENGKSRNDGTLIEPSFEKMRKIASAMETDVISLMRDLGIEVKEDTVSEQKIVASPTLSQHGKDPIEPFHYVPLTQENLNTALREGRLLITPFKVPKKGMLMFIPNTEYDMVIRYEIVDVQGGVYSARAEIGSVEFTLYDIDRVIFHEYNKAKEMLKKLKEEESKGEIGKAKNKLLSPSIGRSWGNDFGRTID